MSKPSDTPHSEPQLASSDVLKSDLAGLLSSRPDVGLDGEFLWPIHPHSLMMLYRASAEHGRAIQIKSETAFGGGLVGGGASKIEVLCSTGAAELFASLGLDLETYGNAFLQVIRSRDETRVIGLRRLPALTMSRYRGGFLQRVPQPNGDTKKITFTEREIIQIKELCPEGRRYALPTWIGAEGMLELAQAATRYNASFFKNNAMPEYAITLKGITPSKEMKSDIQNFFRSEYQGLDNSHRTLILHHPEEGEIKFDKLTEDVKDGDFLKLIDSARERIVVAHGVPPRMLGIMNAGQLGGGGEVSGQLFTFEHLTLKPKRRRMLDQLRPLLAEIGVEPGTAEDSLGSNQIAFRPLDLTPPKDDAANLPDLVQSGILSEDEARSLLPFLQGAPKSASKTPQDAISKSAQQTPVEALAALLTTL